MQINFTNVAQPVRFFSYFFTTNDNMSMDVFDTNGNMRAQFLDFFVGCNYLLSFGLCNAQPNIYDSLTTNYNIGRIDLYSDDGPDSITIDDIRFGVAPEPTSLLLLGTGGLAILANLRRRS
jgi:PEP-CTERM motif